MPSAATRQSTSSRSSTASFDGTASVVDVAGDDEHVRPGVPEDLEEAVEDPGLVGLEGLLEEGTAQVPVGAVEDAERHGGGAVYARGADTGGG